MTNNNQLNERLSYFCVCSPELRCRFVQYAVNESVGNSREKCCLVTRNAPKANGMHAKQKKKRQLSRKQQITTLKLKKIRIHLYLSEK